AGLEMRAAVERHVLDEVGEALLIVRLEQRSRFHGEPERQPLGRPAVLADEVLQPVRQRGGLYPAVERDGLLKVDRLRDEADDGEDRGSGESKEMFVPAPCVRVSAATARSADAHEPSGIGEDRSTIISRWTKTSRP